VRLLSKAFFLKAYMHYYKFNIADWHLATSHLTLEEEAIYFKLVNFYYDTEQPIPAETQTVIRRLRLGSYSETVGLVLSEFFLLEDDGWHHIRCDQEIEKYHDKAENNKKVGKLGGRPRKNKDLETNPEITQTVSKNNPDITLTTNQEPLTNNHSIGAKAPKAKRLDVDSLPTEWLEFCKTTRADLEPTAVFDQFRDYWIAQGGQKGAKLDWFATWRNWVRNQKSVAGSAISKELPLTTDQQIARAYEVECGGDPTKARFNSYYDMKKFVLDFRDKQKRAAA
jgi:uncharacterized protein YdaU (DUF1376 family)